MTTKLPERFRRVGSLVATVSLSTRITRKIGTTQPLSTAPAEVLPVPPMPEATSTASAPPSKRCRMVCIGFTFLVSGLLAALLIDVLPVLGLRAALDPSNPALQRDDNGQIINAQELGVQLVVTSSALWYLAIAGVLSLVSVISSAVSSSKPSTNNWASFILTNLFGIAAATFIATAGILGIVRG